MSTVSEKENVVANNDFDYIPKIVKTTPTLIDEYYVSEALLTIGKLNIPIVSLSNNISPMLSSNFIPFETKAGENPAEHGRRWGKVRALTATDDKNAHDIYIFNIEGGEDYQVHSIIQSLLCYKFCIYDSGVTFIGAEYPEMYNVPGFIVCFKSKSDPTKVLYKGFWNGLEIEETLGVDVGFFIDNTDYGASVYNSTFIVCGNLKEISPNYKIRNKTVIITNIPEKTPSDVQLLYGEAERVLKKIKAENVTKIIFPTAQNKPMSTVPLYQEYRKCANKGFPESYIFGFSLDTTIRIRKEIMKYEYFKFRRHRKSHPYPDGSFVLYSQETTRNNRDGAPENDPNTSQPEADEK